MIDDPKLGLYIKILKLMGKWHKILDFTKWGIPGCSKPVELWKEVCLKRWNLPYSKKLRDPQGDGTKSLKEIKEG